MGQIFKILKKARNKKAIKRSEEYTFFKKFKGMLKSNAAFNKYLDIVIQYTHGILDVK